MPDQIVETPEQARQGRTGVGLRYVLVISVALVVIAFAVTAFIQPM